MELCDPAGRRPGYSTRRYRVMQPGGFNLADRTGDIKRERERGREKSTILFAHSGYDGELDHKGDCQSLCQSETELLTNCVN